LADTLKLFDADADVSGDDVVVEEEPESDGLAAATPGVTTTPAPMPRKTANAPTRPI
jgi:hypothetical protein